MATLWTPPPTWATSQVPAASDMNLMWRDNPTALARRPCIEAWLFGAFPNITNNTWTTVPFNTTNFAVGFGLDGASHELNFAGGGNYKCWFTATLQWAANTTGMRGLRVWDNSNSTELGGTIIDTVATTAVTEINCSGFANLTNTSRIVALAYQSSGGTLLLNGGNLTTSLSLHAIYWN